VPRVRGMHGKRLDDAIERVESLVARVLRGIARTVASLVGGSPSTAALSEDDLQVMRREWMTAVGAELVPALSETYLESAQVLAKEFADVGRPVEVVSLDAPSTADFLDAATNRLVGVSETLWEVARKELADGIRAGEGVEELAARLQQAGGFGEARARMIARTEVVAAANAASLAQALRLGDPSMLKEWLDSDDERVRPAHEFADGQTVPVGEPFEVDGEFLMYPGQPIGSRGNVINERCGLGYSWNDPNEPLTAAAEVHTGAMVALRPSAEDAARLAVDGGEPADQLHTTLMYLGAAADIPEGAQSRIIEAIRGLAEGMPPLTVDGFAVSAFNPGDANDRDPCIVLGLSGDGLDDVHGHVVEALLNLQSEPAGFTLPEQHAPWQPHITLIYTDDMSMVEKLADRVGPVTFDAIRVAFAGEVTDIPLGPTPENPSIDDDDFADVEPPEGWDNHFTARIAEFFASDENLREYWVHGEGAAKIRWGTDGDFTRCVRQLRKYVRDPEGLCAEYHHEALGKWPGEKDHAATANTAPEDALAAADNWVTEPEPDSLDALPGEHFHTRVMEGVSTGMRQFGLGAITWRTPPFAYHWQWRSSAHGGVPETVQVGLVTRAEREADTVHFWGRLDLRSPEGIDYARRLVEGWARWSSVGPDESVKDQYIDVEYVLGDDEDVVVVEEPEIELMTFNQYRVAEVTGVSVPALADATVEPTQELIDTLIEMGVIVPATQQDAPVVDETPDVDVAEFAAVRSHDTPTVDGEWDAGANEKRLPSPLPVEVARAEYAWIDDNQIEGDHVPKSGCSLPHHEVSVDGQPGAANINGVRNALARLSQTDIPEADREAVHAHLAAHLRDAGGEPTDLDAEPEAPLSAASVIVAAGHTITIPDVPPAEWFAEPRDVTANGALTITDEGRLYGYLAPSGVAHRGFRGRRVEVPMGNVDYSRWMGGEAIVAGGARVVAGPITMNCGHMPPTASSDSTSRMEHYDNTCSVVAHAAIGENDRGVWIAGALLPGVTAEQVSRMLACRLSGDWAPHPERAGWREFVAALLVPVPGFPMARSAPSTLKIADGALVAAAVPVQFDVLEEEMGEVNEMGPVLAEGVSVRVLDPRDPGVTEGVIAVVHDGPVYALTVPGSEEPARWYTAQELEVAEAPESDESEPEMAAEIVASTGPDLGPALDFVARKVGRDPASRMAALRSRVHTN
jgi:2'-5' RNA ligase